MEIAVIFATLLALLPFLTGFYVSVLRARSGKISHYSTVSDMSSPLARAHRAHGGTVEYVPILALLILFAGGQPTVETWWLVVGGIAVIARYPAVANFLWIMSALNKGNIVSAVASLLTYAAGAALAVGVCVPYIVELIRY